MHLMRFLMRLSLSAALCCTIVSTVSAQTVSKVFNNATLRTVLNEIERQTGMSVICDSDRIDSHAVISAEFDNADVEDVLNAVLSDEFEYSIENRMIVIHDTRKTQEDGSISGTVYDDTGAPLAGASVIVKGSGNGVMTDADGHFTLSDVDAADVIEITFLGFKTAEYQVGDGTVFDITLENDSEMLDELVIVGYGVQKRSDITGSVASIDNEELLSGPTYNATQALQGKVAGVMVQNTSGSPSASPEIRIRGANSLLYGNSPLIICDGVQGVGLNGINPNEIESIEVLKDAAALSVYGSRGANGVILVTTKKGRGERGQVSYNGFVSIDNVSRILPTIGAQEYATLYNEYRREQGLQPLFDESVIPSMGKGTNWQDKIFRTAVSHNHSVSVNGSKSVFSYYVAAGITQKQGVLLNTDYDMYTLRGNFIADVTPKFKLTMNLYAVYDENNTGGSSSDAIAQALQWSPTVAVYDDDGNYSQPQGNGIGPTPGSNPVGAALENVNKSNSGGFHVSLTGEYRLWKDWLKISSQLVYRTSGSTSGYFDNQVVNMGKSEDISGSKTVSASNTIDNTTMLTFDRAFGKHHVQATGVYEIRKNASNSMGGSGRGIPFRMGWQGINFAQEFDPPYSGYSTSATQSVMGRVNYGFDERYMISGSIRYDGASQLAEGNKFDTFWAVSAGWNISNEKFMKPIKNVLTDLKLRASYGTVGNSAVPAYSSLMLFNSSRDDNDNLVLSVAQAANENLRWERTREVNVGLDANFWDGRLLITAEYYNKLTTDLLMWQKVPVVTNVDQVLRNVGSVSNIGWDFSIGGTPVSTKDFAWSINWTLNLNDNKVKKLDGISDRLIGGQLDYPGLVGSHVQMVGYPMATYLGYRFAGTWKTEEASLASLYDSVPGDAKYVDINKDGKIDSSDITVIGNAQPEGIFGINNTFTWKNLDLNIFFQGVWGNEIYNVNRVRRETFSDVFPTSPTVREHWTPDNQTEYPAFTGKQLLNTDRWVEDGSYFRLKNVSLGYRFPQKWMSKIRVSQLRIYVSGSNLWTLTGYSGYDPEGANGMDASAGVDYGVYPSVRSVVFGIDLTF